MAVGLQPQLRSQIRALRHHAEPCRKRLQSAELTGQRRGRFDRLSRKTLERSTQVPGRALPGRAVLGGVQDERQHAGGRAWTRTRPRGSSSHSESASSRSKTSSGEP